jgi:plastocyanin
LKFRHFFALAAAAAVAIAAPAALAGTRDDGEDEAVPVAVNDACDPATFNAVLGAGACVGSGTVTFGAFIAELTATHKVATWNFSPSTLTIEKGDSLVVTNRGGETHTFTQVSQFGFGIVPILNTLTFGATGPPLPEFASATFLAPGQTQVIRTTGKPQQRLTIGTHLFECAIHPWMQAKVVVLNDEDED